MNDNTYENVIWKYEDDIVITFLVEMCNMLGLV